MNRRRCAAFVVMLLLSASLADASIWPKRWRRKPKTTPGQTVPVDPKNPDSQPAAKEAGRTAGPIPTGGGKNGAQIKGPSGIVIARGQTQQLTWSVTNTTKPISVSVNNCCPWIAKVNGGDTQIVTTSGGDPNTVNLTITGYSPGELKIDVAEVDDSAPDSDRAREIASLFRVKLQWVADRLEAAAKEVPVNYPRSSLPATVRREDVLQLLVRVKADVREALPYDELAPFRDAVDARLAEAAAEVGLPRRVGAAGRQNAIVLVQQDRTPPGGVEEQLFRSIVTRLVGFFRNTSETSPGDTVCFRTTPEHGANILLYPESFPSDRWNVPTTSRKWLYLGRYVFEITKKNYVKGVGSMDLLLDTQRVVECRLSQTAATECAAIAGPIGRCP
jgi:hypothetical protein